MNVGAGAFQGVGAFAHRVEVFDAQCLDDFGQALIAAADECQRQLAFEFGVAAVTERSASRSTAAEGATAFR